jgi:predicted TPR repeat methyltransferase
METPSNRQHDEYASGYDNQVIAYGCHLAEVLFGLCYADTRPGQHLLDAGTGSGLSAVHFARAGLIVDGFDFSQAMLNICREKGITASLKRHDLLEVPWPYPEADYDHLISCGVFHFIHDLDEIFSEARRVLKVGGTFAFTTKSIMSPEPDGGEIKREVSGDFAVYSHSDPYIMRLVETKSFILKKRQRCFGGEDIFCLWVLTKTPQE